MRVDLKVTENAFAHSLSAPVGTAAGGGADRPHTIFPPVSLSLAMVGGKPVRAPEAAPQFPNSARSLSLTWWGGILKSVPVLRPHTIFPPARCRSPWWAESRCGPPSGWLRPNAIASAPRIPNSQARSALKGRYTPRTKVLPPATRRAWTTVLGTM